VRQSAGSASLPHTGGRNLRDLYVKEGKGHYGEQLVCGRAQLIQLLYHTQVDAIQETCMLTREQDIMVSSLCAAERNLLSFSTTLGWTQFERPVC